MDSFGISIAGLSVQIRPLFETTALYCRNYLSDEEPDCVLAVTKDDLLFEQHMLDVEAREEGMKLRKFTDPFLERAAIQRKIAEQLLNRDTLLLHGSTVAVDGYAYLFTAACGTGKSTHTRLWREVFGERAVMVNDDKPFLKFAGDDVIAYGSPWSGKHGLDTNISAPLKGICVLHRGPENVIRKAMPEDVIDMLHHQAFVSDDPALQKITAGLVDRLAQKVALWEMECTKDPCAAEIAHKAMSQTE